MPNINIMVDQSLLRAVNIAAIKADLTQRDFVIKALAKAAGMEAEEVMPNRPEQSIRPTAVTAEGEHRASVETSAKHDTKACRIYGCGLCRVMGVRNQGRGL